MSNHYLTKIEQAIKDNWDKEAVCNYGSDRFTFCDFATNIEKLHVFFEGAGIKKGDHIAICARNSARWAISFFASNTFEAVTVPILADFTPESITSLVAHSESKVLFTEHEIWSKLDVGKIPDLRAVIDNNDYTLLYAEDDRVKQAFDSIHENFQAKYPMGFSRDNVSYPTDNADKLAVINYTSGTTSAPKGVMLLYRSFTVTIEFAQKRVVVSNRDSIVSMLPMAHMYGLAFELLFPICSGASVYYLGKTPSPTLLLKAMQDIKPFMVVTVPLVMEKIYKSAIKPLLSTPSMKFLTAIPGVNKFIYGKIGKALDEKFGGRVRHYIMGGAAMNPEVERLFKKIGLKYCVGYGMTEACPLLAYEDYDKFKFGSCGKPVDCTTIRIDSEDPQNIAGEIQAKGDNICIGYYKNEEATENAFTDDGFLRTGDLGIMDSTGNIFIRGRSKSMILSASGQNIYPEELEAIVNNQNYVVESVVLDRSSKIVALVYLDEASIKKDKLDDEAVSDIPETIRINSNKLLPSYSQITKVEVMDKPFEKTPKMSIKRFLYK